MLLKTKEQLNAEALQMLNETEDKSEAIVKVVEMLANSTHQELIERVQSEARQAAADEEFRKNLKLRALNTEETKFYNSMVKGARMGLTAEQVDIIPTSIIDKTLEDVKESSELLSLVNFAPADVKKWVVAAKSGTFAWGDLSSDVTAELSTTLSALNIELAKLSVYLVIPKAVRELALPFVDRYFMAILAEAMNDGLEYGFLLGNGDNQPIGIMKQIGSSTNGVHADKVAKTNITSFSPASLKEVRKTLSKDGKRKIPTLVLVCNPADRYAYVDPALFGETLAGGYAQKTFLNMEIKESINCPVGKGVFTIPAAYTMGFSGLKVDEYKETKALQDCDLVIAKAYANGRATDDATAVVFDITKLVEYKIPAVVVTP